MAQLRLLDTTSSNGKRFTTQQSVNAAVKSACDIMRRSNCAGALQCVPELTWILFLRILDERETQEAEEADAVGVEYSPSLVAPTAGRIGPRPTARSGPSSRMAPSARSLTS